MRLIVREQEKDNGGVSVDVTPGLQACVRWAKFHRIASHALRGVEVGSSILILLVLAIVSLSEVYIRIGFIIATSLAAINGVAVALLHHFRFESQSRKYGSASRALDRIDDHYRKAMRGADVNRQWELLLWCKNAIAEVERLLGNADVTDVDLSFQLEDLPGPRTAADTRGRQESETPGR